MDKDTLKKIRDSVKHTIKKLEEDGMTDIDSDIEKVLIVYNKVLKLCNYNEKMARGVIELAVEELQREESGDVVFMINRLNEK